MTEETTTQKILKVEMGFAPEAAAELERLKTVSRTESNEQLFADALRVYGWYLEHKNALFTKQDDVWVRVDLQL
jgi:hypothetical protein